MVVSQKVLDPVRLRRRETGFCVVTVFHSFDPAFGPAVYRFCGFIIFSRRAEVIVSGCALLSGIVLLRGEKQE
jgi:hypothetical protein